MKIEIELVPGNKWKITHGLDPDRPTVTDRPDLAAFQVLQYMGIFIPASTEVKRHLLSEGW